MKISRLNLSLSAVVLWLFLFLLPTQLGKHFFLDFSYISGVRIDYLAPALYLTDLLVGLLVGMYWRHVLDGIVKHARKLMILLPLIVLNIAFSQQPLLALYGWVRIAEIYAIGVLFSSIHIPQLLSFSALSAGAFIQLILTGAQFQLHRALQGPWYWLGERALSSSLPGVAKASLFGTEILRPYGTFSHPNSLAGFYVLVIAWLLVTPSLSKQTQKLKIIILLLASMLVLISFSKTAILALALIVAWHGLSTGKLVTSCRLCMTARIIAGLSILGIFLSAHGDVYSLQKRLVLMKEATSIILAHPLFGTGLWNNLYEHARFAQKYGHVFIQPVHNILLLWIMQTGLIISSLMGWWLWSWLRLHLKRQAHFLMPLAVLVLTGSVDHYWLTLQQNMLLMGVVGGMIMQRVSKS